MRDLLLTKLLSQFEEITDFTLSFLQSLFLLLLEKPFFSICHFSNLSLLWNASKLEKAHLSLNGQIANLPRLVSQKKRSGVLFRVTSIICITGMTTSTLFVLQNLKQVLLEQRFLQGCQLEQSFSLHYLTQQEEDRHTYLVLLPI